MSDTCLNFDESVYCSDVFLPPQTLEGHKRELTYQKIYDSSSVYFRGAIDALDGGLNLLANGLVGQAHVLFTHAFEVTCKGVIDERIRLGEQRFMAQNPQLAKRMAALNAEFVADFDTRKIRRLNFVDAFNKAHSLLGLDSELKDQVCFYSTRNKIIHEGEVCGQRHEYFREIINQILPLTQHAFTWALDCNLVELVRPKLARELIIAERIMRKRGMREEALNLALYTYRKTFDFLFSPELGTPDGTIQRDGYITFSSADDDRKDAYAGWLKAQMKGQVYGECLWASSSAESLYCHICDERCLIAIDDELVGTPPEGYFPITAVACTHCNLWLTENESDLIAEHYGHLDSNVLSKQAWLDLLYDFDYLDANFRIKQ